MYTGLGDDLEELSSEVKKAVESSQFYTDMKQATHHIGKVIDTKDPEKRGRIKVRIAGVHNTETPAEEIQWMDIKPSLGTNSGIGSKPTFQIGQMVTVNPLTPGGAEWLVTAGTNILQKELNTLFGSNKDKDGTPFSADANKNPKLSKDVIPKIASTILSKLKETLWAVIKAKIIRAIIGKPGGPTDPGNFDNAPIKVDNIEFITDDLVADIFGREYPINEYVYYDLSSLGLPIDKKPVQLEDVIIELLPYDDNEENCPGVDEELFGWNSNSEKECAKIEDFNFVVPPNVKYTNDDGTEGKIYSVKYKVTSKTDENNTDTGSIKVKIVRQRNPKYKTIPLGAGYNFQTQSGVHTPQYKLEEHPPDSEKGNSEDKTVRQLPNKMSIEEDGSDDNAYYAIKHPTGSRFDLHHSGNGTLKTNADLQLISNGHTTVYAGGQYNLAAMTWLNIKSPTTYIEGKVIIQGDVEVYGNMMIDGNLTVTGTIDATKEIASADEVYAKTRAGVKLSKHDHKAKPGCPDGDCKSP